MKNPIFAPDRCSHLVVVSIFLSSLVLAQERDHTVDANGKKAGHAVAPTAIRAGSAKVGGLAPAFRVTDTAGKPVSVGAKNAKPTVVVFLDANCPCCKSGKPYLDRVESYYGDVANVIGLVVGDAAVAKSWEKRSKPQFRVAADLGGKVAARYGAKIALTTVLVGTDGRIVRFYPGYSQGSLRELTASIARLAKVKDRNMEVRPAPTALTSGCSLAGM